MIEEQPPTPANFVANIDNWQRLAPVNPESDALSWMQPHIPMCRFDGRKWAGKKMPDLIVSCSGPAGYWDDASFGNYGYCAYHWSLHIHKQLFAGNIVANPKYTQADRSRDQMISDLYTTERQERGLPTYS